MIEFRTVYVIMGNDFPETVFSRLDSAEAFCEMMILENKQKIANEGGRRIYWRVTPFVMDARLPSTKEKEIK